MKTPQNLRDLRRQRDMQKRAEQSTRASEEMKDKLSDLQSKDYTEHLDDIQASGELTAEITEQSLGEHREQTRTLKDIMAASELNAENTELANQKLTELNANAVQGFEKISEFAQQLRESIKAMPASPVPPSIPVEVEQEEDEATPREAPQRQENLAEYLKLLMGGLFVAKPKTEEEKPKPKENDDTNSKFDLVLDRLDGIAKITQKGFNKTIHLADDIASALFKFTVSAMLNTAKLAALVFGVVLIADILTIHFRHWSKMFNENFLTFREKLGTLAKPMGELLTTLEDIYNYWKRGEYEKLVEEIGSAVASASKYLFDALLLGLGKAVASLIRALGKDEIADDVEAAAIMRANREMGYKLSEEEEELVAKTYERQNTEAREAIEKKRDRIRGGFNASVLLTTDKQREEDNKILEGATATGKQRLVSEQIDNDLYNLADIIKKNDTNLNLNKNFGKKLDAIKVTIEKDAQDGKITSSQAEELRNKVNEVEMLAETQSRKIAQSMAPKIEAKPAEVNQDVERVKTIEKAEKTPVQPQQPQQTNVNQNTAIVKQNNQTFVIAPITSRDAPGLGNKL